MISVDEIISGYASESLNSRMQVFLSRYVKIPLFYVLTVIGFSQSLRVDKTTVLLNLTIFAVISKHFFVDTYTIWTPINDNK